MKTHPVILVLLVASAGASGASIRSIDSKLEVLTSTPIAEALEKIEPAQIATVSPKAFYSDITTFSGHGFAFGGTATAISPSGIGRGLVTSLACDDLTFKGTPPSITLSSFTFSVANFNTVAVNAEPSVLFYKNDGASGGPGTLIDGITFGVFSAPLGASTVSLISVDLTTPPPSGAFPIPLGSGGTATIWACLMFDNNNGTTSGGSGATLAQMNNLGAGLFAPVDVGSSANNLFISTAPVVAPYTNPAGSQGNFGAAPAPVADMGWELVHP